MSETISRPFDMAAFLSDITAGKVKPEEISSILFEVQFEKIQREDPPLAEILLGCSLPIYFQEEIIAVLRAPADETHSNRHILDTLIEFPFIGARTDGKGYYFLENVRPAALQKLEGEGYRRQDQLFRERLVAYFTARLDSCLKRTIMTLLCRKSASWSSSTATRKGISIPAPKF
jgi:hypothetical protein